MNNFCSFKTLFGLDTSKSSKSSSSGRASSRGTGGGGGGGGGWGSGGGRPNGWAFIFYFTTYSEILSLENTLMDNFEQFNLNIT